MAGLGIGVDSSYSSANELHMAIAKQDAGISNTKPDLEVTDDVFTQALNHLKKQTPQKRPMVLEKIRKEKKNQLTSAQYKKLEAV